MTKFAHLEVATLRALGAAVLAARPTFDESGDWKDHAASWSYGIGEAIRSLPAERIERRSMLRAALAEGLLSGWSAPRSFQEAVARLSSVLEEAEARLW